MEGYDVHFHLRLYWSDISYGTYAYYADILIL